MIDLQTVIAIVGFLLGVDGAAFVYAYLCRNRSGKSDGELHRRIDALHERLNIFELEVARNYVTLDHLKDVERRLTDILRRIERRVDDLANNRNPE